MERKFRSFYIGALAVIGVGFLGTALVPKAHADAWDKRTIVTVNEPIIAGNEVLQPGTYVWKLLDSQSNRHVVQIFDRDQRRLESTTLAIPNYRLQPIGKSQFAFWETPAGVPKAVRAWFYPGDKFGQEFAYPKKLVARLATAASAPLSMDRKVATPPVPTPEAQHVSAPQREPQQSFVGLSAAMPIIRSLSHTASPNILVGLLGLGFLSLSGLISLFNNKNA